MKPLEALARFELVRALGADARAEIDAQARVRVVAPGTRLIERGTECGGVFLVTLGAIRVFFVRPNGREGTLYWVDEGQPCFLSLDCAFKQVPYPAWAEADDRPTQFVVIPAALFRRLYENEPAARRFAFDALSERVHELMGLIEQSATLALEQRAAALLLERADDDGTVSTSQERLASHLGTAREVLARILRSFRSEGLVETRRRRVVILEPDALRKLADASR